MRRPLILALLALPLLLAMSWPSPTVYLVDKTGGGWPLKRAAAKWSEGSALDLRVVDACPPGETQCVPVLEERMVGPVAGLTYLTPLDGDIISVRVVLDSTERDATWKTRRAIVCHELGHAIGLVKHRRYGCMTESAGAWWPGKRALARVEALYGP